jgi:hypothetical protein
MLSVASEQDRRCRENNGNSRLSSLCALSVSCERKRYRSRSFSRNELRFVRRDRARTWSNARRTDAQVRIAASRPLR